MKFEKVTDRCYYFQGAVNIGYILDGENGFLIDTGIDRSVAKKVVHLLDNNNLPLTHVFLTHAHADHYGGAAYIQKERKVLTIAPPFEEAIMRNPTIHTMMMNFGNGNHQELSNKFLQGPPVKIDTICTIGKNVISGTTITTVHFPGHSHYQTGVLFDNILYAADAYFGQDALKKHKIPFIVDAEKTMETLDKLLEIQCAGSIPGHGYFEENLHNTVKGNIDLHKAVFSSIIEILTEKEELQLEDIVAFVCSKWEITLNSIMALALYRTSINAYVMKAYNENLISYRFHNNKMLFSIVKDIR